MDVAPLSLLTGCLLYATRAVHMGTRSSQDQAPITVPRVPSDTRIELALLADELRRHERCGDCRDARQIRARIDQVLDAC